MLARLRRLSVRQPHRTYAKRAARELDLRMNSVGDAGLRALIDCSSHRLLPGFAC